MLGYILRVHPSWMKFIELGKTLGKPLVMRLNLNQQSNGPAWTWHKNLIDSLIPIVDCGVHYVDVMCQLTGAKPVRVHGIGAKLWEEAAKQNYGHLHVTFDDGSVGWYEAGWGPMMSEVAFFVEHHLGDLGGCERIDHEGRDVVRPRDDVDLLALQLVDHGLDARAAHADACADRIDRGIARDHRDLGARAGVARRRLHLDDAVVDLGHLLGEQLGHELRVSARE